MNFTAYIARQKNIIRSRHMGETYLLSGGEVIPVRSTEELLFELDSMRGLNKRERSGAYVKRRVGA